MSGRRRHARFVVANNQGVLQVACDVTVVLSDGALFAFSNEPATVGDVLTIDLIVDGEIERVAVGVEECRLVVDGAKLRHRIRLARADSRRAPGNDETEQ
jgi:hypothetical protein